MRAVLSALWQVRRALAIYAFLLVAGVVAGHFLREVAIPDVRPGNEPVMHRFISLALILFVLASAMPFVPGAEIGFALLLVFGAQAAPVVYLAMVLALTTAYAVARLVPLGSLAGGLLWLGLSRTAGLVVDIASVPRTERLEHVLGRFDWSPGEILLRNRHLALALAINTPGNSLVGGGGGLAFAAGASGLFSAPAFILTVAIAVAPVPLLFLLL